MEIKAVSKVAAFLAMALVAAAADEISTSALPEIQRIKEPYLRNLNIIHTTRDNRVQPITAHYVTALQRLQTDLKAKNDAAGAEAVQAEIDRVNAGKDRNPDGERPQAPAALPKLRAQYESDVQRVVASFETAELQQKHQYAQNLGVEQRRLLAENQVQKAAAVGAERDSLGVADLAKHSANAVGPKTAESTVRASGALDPVVAGKIAPVVSGKSYRKTDTCDGDQEGWPDTAEGAGGVLVGFEFMELPSDKGKWVRSLRPYYLTDKGLVAGKDRGKMEKITDKILARPGYAVSGLLCSARKNGIQVLFCKIDPATGLFDPASGSTYKSKWFGTQQNRDKPRQIGGDGHLIIGVYGKTGADCDNIGLLEMP